MASTLTPGSLQATQAASRLYQLSAILSMMSIVGHSKNGFDKVYPALATIPALPEYAVGKSGASNGWGYINASLLIAALLNWQWSRTSGPRTKEEKAMLYTLAVAGGLWSVRYAQVKSYLPLLPLLVAPSCSVAAHFLQS